MITVLNVDDRERPKRASREVNRDRAVWVDEQTITLLYNPFLYSRCRKSVLQREGDTCQWCGAPATTLDHIVPSSNGGSDRPLNLLASCGDCKK